MVDKISSSSVGYLFGILSIVFAFFTPLAGIILAIIGLVKIRGEKSEESRKAKKMNILGLVLGIIVLAATISVTIYSMLYGVGGISA